MRNCLVDTTIIISSSRGNLQEACTDRFDDVAGNPEGWEIPSLCIK